MRRGARHGQDFTGRLAQGFTGLIQSNITPPSFPWPNPHNSKLFDLEFPSQSFGTRDFGLVTHDSSGINGVSAIFDIGNRIGQAGVDFSAGLNGLVQQFFRSLPVPFQHEDNVGVGATAVQLDAEGSCRLRSDLGVATQGDLACQLDSNPRCHLLVVFSTWMVNAFEEQIGSAVESAITKKLNEGILKLDSFLQALPKEIPVDDNASLNVTFVNDPLLSNSSIEFEINGLFTGRKRDPVPRYHHENSQTLVFCPDSSKMLGIALDEAVFNSASSLYYNAAFMQWIVDKIPDQSLLNTAGWRFIVPQLYKKYPNDDMALNISLSSPPVIMIAENNIDATINVDLIIDVLEASEAIPVVCISLVIRASGLVKIVGNNLAGSVKLNDFTMSLKWSNIGNLRLYLIQPVMWTIIQTVFLPYTNSHLAKGFPLPIIHGLTLHNANIICSDSRIIVCSDVYSESNNLSHLLIHLVDKYKLHF
uniref:Lipid-binding serum glycoprotein C-terminal domain-containing protein n=1 Tax=Fagus sylvatica TaxID=28930 RepID=A0A2N9EPR4_FAGSY